MFIARIAFFRLEESAKFLANAGDHAGALIALTRISKINGDSEVWSLEDVIDRLPTEEFDGEAEGGKYNAMGEADESLEERSHASPVTEEAPTGPLYQYGVSSRNLTVEERKRGEKLVMGSSWIGQIPMAIKESLGDFPERLDRLFEPDWALTTRLVWIIWFAASAGYTVSLSRHSYLSSDVLSSMRMSLLTFLDSDFQWLSAKVARDKGRYGTRWRWTSSESGRLFVPLLHFLDRSLNFRLHLRCPLHSIRHPRLHPRRLFDRDVLG